MNRSLSLLTAVLFAASTSFAQTGDAWKKTVSRTIDISQREDTVKHHLTDVSSDSTLLELVINAVKSGKLTAYNAFDHNFTTKLTIATLKEIIAPKTDTMTIVDPVTGTEIQKIIRRDFDPTVIRKYRILEEWAFNPRTGKTDIQITGIAPMLEVYGEDGSYRGSKSMFWVRYNDARPVVEKYDQMHPNHTLASLIWDDYFLSEVKPNKEK